MRHALLIGLVAVGCGGSADGAKAVDAGTDTTSDVVDAAPSGCPGSLPAPGTRCSASDEGTGCTYGEEPAPWCRKKATCIGSTIFAWTVTDGSCSDGCPAEAPVTGTSCSTREHCAWNDGTMCACDTAPPGSWKCKAPPADARCPRIAPNLGTACTNEGLSCDYTLPIYCLDCHALGYVAKCEAGVWHVSSELTAP